MIKKVFNTPQAVAEAFAAEFAATVNEAQSSP